MAGNNKSSGKKNLEQSPWSLLSFLPTVAGGIANIVASPERRSLRDMQSGGGVGSRAMAGATQQVMANQIAATTQGRGATRGLGLHDAASRGAQTLASALPGMGMVAAREQALATDQLRQNRYGQLRAGLNLGAGLTGAIAAGMANRVQAQDQGEGAAKKADSGPRGDGISRWDLPEGYTGEVPSANWLPDPLVAPGQLTVPSNPPSALESVLQLQRPDILQSESVPGATQLQQSPFMQSAGAPAPQAEPVSQGQAKPLRQPQGKAAPQEEKAAPQGGVSQPQTSEEERQQGMSLEGQESVMPEETTFQRATQEILAAQARKAVALGLPFDQTKPEAPLGSPDIDIAGAFQAEAPAPLLQAGSEAGTSNEERLQQGIEQVLRLMSEGVMQPTEAYQMLQDMGVANPDQVLGWSTQSGWLPGSEAWRP